MAKTCNKIGGKMYKMSDRKYTKKQKEFAFSHFPLYRDKSLKHTRGGGGAYDIRIDAASSTLEQQQKAAWESSHTSRKQILRLWGFRRLSENAYKRGEHPTRDQLTNRRKFPLRGHIVWLLLHRKAKVTRGAQSKPSQRAPIWS